MNSSWGACSFLLLTMAAFCGGRNAADYFQERRFRYSPSRPEDALVLYLGNAPPIICEPDARDVCSKTFNGNDDFCVELPQGYDDYICTFEGHAPIKTNLKLIEDTFESLYVINARTIRKFWEKKMYCTANSQLPDEYFHMKVERPHEDHTVKCRFLNDSGTVYLQFQRYPTIACSVGNAAGGYHFTVPGIDESFACAFRVYSELPLGDSSTEQRLYRSLLAGLPSRADGAPPRLQCSRHSDADTASNATALFQLQLATGTSYDCTYPDAVPRSLPP